MGLAPTTSTTMMLSLGDALAVALMERKGFSPDLVRRVVSMVDRNEYKRRQAPPGIKITGRAFGRDRRLPIANRYRPR